MARIQRHQSLYDSWIPLIENKINDYCIFVNGYRNNNIDYLISAYISIINIVNAIVPGLDKYGSQYREYSTLPKKPYAANHSFQVFC